MRRKEELTVCVPPHAKVKKKVGPKERAFLLGGGLFNTVGGVWLLSINEVPAGMLCLTFGLLGLIVGRKRTKRMY